MMWRYEYVSVIFFSISETDVDFRYTFSHFVFFLIIELPYESFNLYITIRETRRMLLFF